MGDMLLNSDQELRYRTHGLSIEEQQAYVKSLTQNQNAVTGLEGTELEGVDITGVSIDSFTPSTSADEAASTTPAPSLIITNDVSTLDTKNKEKVLEHFGLLEHRALSGGFIEPEISTNVDDFEFQYDKNGNITDVYRKNKSVDGTSFQADRWALRYDKDGNLSKSFIQDIDENGKVLGQEITNYNKDGSVKNTALYRYQYDEQGQQTGQTRYVEDAKYGDAANVLSSVFGVDTSGISLITADMITPIGVDTPSFYEGIDGIHRNQNGQITEFTYNGQRYALRYDKDGNLTKSFVQTKDDNGTVRSQTITNIKSDGTKVTEKHTYDEQGVENTSDAQKAMNKVNSLYASKTGDISKSEDTYNKFQSFLNNNTMAKLKAAGCSNEEIKAVLDDLFKNVDEKLYSKQFTGTDEEKEMIAKYKEQYKKIFGTEPMIMYLDSVVDEAA